MPRRILMGFLKKVVTLRPGEGPTAVLMFTYSFLAMTSYNIVKPMTRSTFIADLGADNLPYIQFTAAVLIGVMMDLYVRLGMRLPRRALIPVTLGILVAILLAFWVLFQFDAAWVPAVFYLFGLLFGILVISQFWTLANEIYDARQARRIFGFIGGGSALGGMLGNGILSLGTTTIGTVNLLLVSAAFLTICLSIVTVITRRQSLPDDPAALDAERGVGGGEALRLLKASRQLQVIALVIGFAAIGAVTIEQQLNMATEASGEDVDQMTQ
ncbi:MAG TPA: Npt1/Npt2 family nucleotide transporter, partial [Vicinamibacterales bacterium]|nr:Npt1/Npt2 family nucleotide transporter [Vicinamibacterales bacterium]